MSDVSNEKKPEHVSEHAVVETKASDTPKTNTLAILSLIFSFFASLFGLILGIVALKQIKEKGEGGKNLAIAGIIISIINMIIGIIFDIFLMRGIIAASKTDVSDYNSETGGANTSEQTTVGNSPEVGLNEITTIGDVELKAVSLKEPKTEGFQKPKAGNIYLNVEIEVTNKGFETEYISSSLVSLKDSENSKYEYSIFAVPSGESTINGELASNDTVKGYVGFEVPKDAEGLKLYFDNTDYSGSSAVVDLGR